MRLTGLLILIALTAPCVASPARPAPIQSGDWLELIDVTRLPYVKDGAVMEVSSYDRTGGNDDGFSGKYSFVRKEGNRYVIFDEKGPGCIYRFWTANMGQGRTRFYFDGETEPRIDVPKLDDLFSGRAEPFVPPISQHVLGGSCSYVPIPFAKSCKIVCDTQPNFHQITWHRFPEGRNVTTFGGQLSAGDRGKFDRVRTAWSRLGDIPWHLSPSAGTRRASGRLRSGRSASLAEMKGPGMVRAIRIRAGSTDARLFRTALLEIFVDGERKPSVWSPLGDFFLDGFGQGISQSLLLGKKDGWYYCYYPMPYAKDIRMKLTNQSLADMRFEAEVSWDPLDSLPAGMGRFHAWWHRQNPTAPGTLFPILEAAGHGQWCGVSHAMQGTGGLGFLEGDEMARIDDRDESSYHGTGTEDYFNGGWYFGAVGSAPMSGCGVYDPVGSRCLAYRMQLSDCVPFEQKANVGIEHGHANSERADYAGVTYWYAAQGASDQFSPVPVADRIPTSLGIPMATEAEDILANNRGDTRVVADTGLLFPTSHGRAVMAGPSSTPTVNLNLDVKETGIYSLEAQLISSPRGGLVQAMLDGVKLGDPIDCRAPGQGIVPLRMLTEGVRLRRGTHMLAFRMSAGDADSHQFSVDCIRLKQKGLLDAEKLRVTGASGGPVAEQNLASWGSQWSNDAQLFFTPTSPGSAFTLELPVEKDGLYAVSAYFTQAPDYGIVQAKIDGRSLVAPIDLYAPTVRRTARIDLGVAKLQAGAHSLTIEVVGKSAGSTGYYAGLDAVSLK